MTIHISKNSPKRPTAKWSIYLQRDRVGISFRFRGNAHVFMRQRFSNSRPLEFTADERFVAADAIRDWVHEQPWSLCNAGVDVCPDWPTAFEIRDIALNSIERMASRPDPSRDVVRWIRMGMFEPKMKHKAPVL